MGANDLQSIATGDQNQRVKNQNARKWIAVGTEAWQRAYTDRVQALVETLKPQRCASVVWLLQPALSEQQIPARVSRHDQRGAVRRRSLRDGHV